MEILNYFINFIPYIIALLFPIFIFVAVILFTSRMAYRSEFIAILNSGMTFKRMLRPYFVGAGLICILLLFANHYIIPVANKGRLQFERKYIEKSENRTSSNIYVRMNPKEFVYINSFNLGTKNGNQFMYDKIQGIHLQKRISADRFSFDSAQNIWILYDVKKRINNGLKESFEELPVLKLKLPLVPQDISEVFEARQHMTTPRLNTYIAKERARGSESLNNFLIEKHRRSAAPFSAFILSIIGACIASRRIRGGNGIHLALGLLISAAYILFMQFSTTFSVKGNLSPFLSVWIPNIFFGIIAVLLYRKRARN